MLIKNKLKKINFKLFKKQYKNVNNNLFYSRKIYKILRQQIQSNIFLKKKNTKQFIIIQNKNSYINK